MIRVLILIVLETFYIRIIYYSFQKILMMIMLNEKKNNTKYIK